MRHTSSLTTIAGALQKVFLPFAISPNYPIPSCCRCSSGNRAHCVPPFPLTGVRRPGIRYASNSFFPRQARQTQYDVDKKAFGPKYDGPPRDEDIDAYKVHIVEPDGKLTEPRLLMNVLDARKRDEKDRPTQYVLVVSPAGPERRFPICKVYDKQVMREKEEAKRKAAKASKMEEKQLELSWTIGHHDLGHRLGKLKEFLLKGCRVDIVVGSRRHKGWNRKRDITNEDAEKLLARIRSEVREVEGAKERLAMDGRLCEEAVLHFEGSKIKGSDSTDLKPQTVLSK